MRSFLVNIHHKLSLNIFLHIIEMTHSSIHFLRYNIFWNVKVLYKFIGMIIIILINLPFFLVLSKNETISSKRAELELTQWVQMQNKVPFWKNIFSLPIHSVLENIFVLYNIFGEMSGPSHKSHILKNILRNLQSCIERFRWTIIEIMKSFDTRFGNLRTKTVPY